MKKFIYKIIVFIVAVLLVITIGFFLPQTPRASKSLLNSQIQKDKLLETIDEPRIILIGGSNLSLGINSQIIKDSLDLNPINTAIHATIGLVYMLDHVQKYLRDGDIVVIVPEYDHFFGDFAYGQEELLRLVADHNKSDLMKLRWKQKKSIIKYILKYSFSKFKPLEYLRANEDPIYGVNSFNQYGDAVNHWGLSKQVFPDITPYEENFNYEIIELLKEFEQNVQTMNVSVFISFPAFQDNAYNIRKDQILRLEKELVINEFNILGNSKRYSIADSLTFDTPYHLLKSGVDLRTHKLVQDLKLNLNNKINP